MLSKKVNAALSSQVNYELYSAYIYFGMAAAMETAGFKGASHWMRTQANEELFHAAKLFDYVYSRDGQVELPEIKGVKNTYDSPLQAFETAYAHEKSVTERFCKMTDLVLQEKDHVTNAFIQWFITEQIEEEDNVRSIVDRLKRIKNSPDAMYQLDSELAARTLSATINLINTAGTAN